MSPGALATKVADGRATLYRRRRRARSMALFHRDRLRRRRSTRGIDIPSGGSEVRELRSRGVVTLTAHADRERLGVVHSVLEEALDTGSELLLPITEHALSPGADRTSARHLVSADVVADGQGAFRSITQAAGIAQPLLADPAVVDLVFDERLIDLAGAYLGAAPAITGVNLRKSFANDLPPFDTLYYHRDGNSARFVKFFFYLHDVGPGGGAFTYVPGSHRRRRERMSQKRWSDEEVAEWYPDSPGVELTAAAGDVIAADTTGFHRGTKPTAADRSMLTVYYAVHPEFGGEGRPFELAADDLARLSPKQQRAADFLTVVERPLRPMGQRDVIPGREPS
ncbi:MAG: phytanoyl-CoA dioxygenase family protein [Actinomycetota bacterium]